MNLLMLFIIVGFVSVGVSVFVIFLQMYKVSVKTRTSSVSIPVFTGCSPQEISTRMVGFVCMGYFLMHILSNKAHPFNDVEYLERYKAYIQNPSTITYIQNIKGEYDYD